MSSARWQHDAKRNKAIVDAIVARLKWLDGYTGDNDTHHGVCLAVSLIRADLNRARQKHPRYKSRPATLDTPDAIG